MHVSRRVEFIEVVSRSRRPRDPYRSTKKKNATMWLKFNTEYVAGIVGGAGLLLFLLALSADSGMISANGLTGAGTKFAGLAMILAGGGMKWRAQGRSKQ